MGRSVFAFVLACIASLLLAPTTFAQTALEAWHAHGQTWLVWVDDQGLGPAETYDVYRSSSPITDLSSATLVGQVLPADWRAVRLDLIDDADRTWTIPDGQGGARTLRAIEALFVYTPHEAIDEYFAVVAHGETNVGPGNSTGPVAQTLDPVICHAQATGTTETGYAFTVYAHWVDGRADHESGRADYPVMGNASANGTGHVFAVYEPLGGRPPGLLPAVLQFHGGKGSYVGWEPGRGSQASQIDNVVDGGFVVALDDALQVVKDTILGVRATTENTRWFGTWNAYDRFVVPTTDPPDDALVVDYTQRRVRFIILWLRANLPIDSARVGLMGHSMGALATSFLTRHYPELFSAGTAFEPPYYEGGNPFNRYMQGSTEQNLLTNLPGPTRLTDFYRPSTLLPGTGSLPFVRIIWGRNDPTLVWDEGNGINVPDAMAGLDAIRRGHHVYWDERVHTVDEWEGRFVGSPRHSANEIARHRANRSFPAISDDDHDEAPGRQPDPGAGPITDGDPWGTWGGYFDWELSSIEDTADAWAATIFLVGGSPFAADIAPSASAIATVTPRRLQSFAPAPLAPLYFTLRDAADETLRQHGPVAADAEGVVSIEALVVPRDPERVRLRVTPARDDDADARDAQIDCDDTNASVWATPGEVVELALLPDTVTLAWQEPSAPGALADAIRYDVLRATGPAAFDEAACVVSDEGPAREAVDIDVPLGGAAFFYLVRARNACPAGLGTLGSTSAGIPRTGRACP